MSSDNLYPTEWVGGKIPCKPIISLNGKFYKAETRVTGKLIRKCFYWESSKSQNNFDTKDEAYVHCLRWIRDIYEEKDAIKNQYRYIDENRVEVKLNQGRTMVIDVDDLDIVNKSNWSANRGNNTFYCKSAIHGKNFHNVITGYAIVDHIDGDVI